MHIAQARGEVCTIKLGMAEPAARGLEEGVAINLGMDWRLRPGGMNDLEKTTKAAVFGEGDVTLEEEVIKCSWDCGFVCWT